MRNQPNILFIDIETSPTVVYTWDARPRFISPDHIVEDGKTICFAAKWYDRRGVMFKSAYHDGEDEMFQTAWDLLGQADAIVSYNGKRFDEKHLNKDFFLRRMGPPAPYHHIDLFHTARKFQLFSRKLDELARRLDLRGKVKHMGMDLWKGCMNDSDKHWSIMRRYNKRDVTLLEEVYDEMRPWITSPMNWALYVDADGPVCVRCGSDNLQSRGFAYTKTQKYRRFQCMDCGRWNRSRSTAVSPAKRGNILA